MYRISTFAVMLTCFCSAFIQASFIDSINFCGVVPDILFLTAIFFALCCEEDEWFGAAFLCGFFKDTISHFVLGSYVFSFLAAGFFLHKHRTKFYKEKFTTQLIISFTSYIFMGYLVLLINSFAGKYPLDLPGFFPILARGAVYTGLVSPVIFIIFSRILGIRLARGYY